jgi:hypothetical protein
VELCGICRCEPEVDLEEVRGSWEQAPPTLSIGLESFEYCVEGDVLTFVGSNHLRYTFDRKIPMDTLPTACPLREPEDCRSGCSMGGCYGAAHCAGTSEAGCGPAIGCTWDATACVGVPNNPCGIEDYDVVPGCTFAPGLPSASDAGL